MMASAHAVKREPVALWYWMDVGVSLGVGSGWDARCVGTETRVDSKDGDKPYTVFICHVMAKRRQWKIARRFKQFVNLSEWLEENMPSLAAVLPPLPSKVKLLQKESEVARERAVLLELWLKRLLEVCWI